MDGWVDDKDKRAGALICIVAETWKQCKVSLKSKSNDNFYIAHISIPRMLTALGVYIQMYRDRSC
jgi:hypothetical protein